MGVPLYVICCFSLDAFNILSDSLIFVILITGCLGVFLFGLMSWCVPIIPYGTWHVLDLGDCFLSQVKDVFSYYLFKYFLRPLFSLFSSLDSGIPIMQILVPLMLSQRSLKLPFSFFSVWWQ